MNVEALNRLFEEPAPESSIRKARSLDPSAPLVDQADATPSIADASVGALAPELEFAAGTVLNDRYRLDRKAGEGAMGVVFAATHLGLDEAVAIKFMRREMQDVEGTLARFANEAKIAARIRSEHVIKVLDVGVAGPLGPYIVMEYLEGRSLADILESDGPLPVPRLVEYVLQACEALAAAHAHQVVHRDVKPDNLFVARQGGLEIVKLLDFGISKAPRPGLVAADDAGTSTASVTMGTPLYMSPEQLRSTTDVDTRTDIWSLGAAMYELSCGEPPFKAGSVAEIIAAVLDHAPAELPETCPAELRAIVGRCLQKEPGARFQSVAELAQALMPLAPANARAHASRASCILQGSLHAAPKGSIGGAALGPGVRAEPALPEGAESGAKRAYAGRFQSSALVAAATVLALGALGVVTSLAGDAGPRGEPVAAAARLRSSAAKTEVAAPSAVELPMSGMLAPSTAAEASPELSPLMSLGGPVPSPEARRIGQPQPARSVSKRTSPRRSTAGPSSAGARAVAPGANPKALRVRLVAPPRIKLVEGSANPSHRRAR
jgi:tRNA A-37 threonylcarbamoyl transferase component Bud32